MTIQKTKSLSADTLQELSEKLNAFYSVFPSVFATQVFLRGVDRQWYEALVYYRDGVK